jgi:16S rRNA (uracil1498-N3)-methyltransferase
MKISRFYQQNEIKVGDEIELSTANHRHAVQVLRLKLDQSLILFNGKGGEYHAKISYLDKRNSRVLIEKYDSTTRESKLSTTLALAMIKPDKMDFAIQKSVEMGVRNIQPIYTKRSVIKIKANRLEKKIQHWQGVIIAACEQSGRTKIPELYEPVNLEKFLGQNARSSNNSSCIAMFPGDHPTIKRINENIEKLSLLIGPEGGFTDDEEELIQQKGVTPISFGTRILRAETAVIAGLTACQQQWGDL